MPTCDYCESDFNSESDYLDHLADAHDGELTRIDKRRVEQHTSTDTDSENRRFILIGGTLLGVAILGVVLTLTVLSPGQNSSGVDVEKDPSFVGSQHYHASMTVTIDGEQLDFSQDKYQLQSKPAHFESGNGEKLHIHAKGVTLEYALAVHGIKTTHGDTVTVNGNTYSASNGDTVKITVNGDSVDPSTYVIQKGDTIRVRLADA